MHANVSESKVTANGAAPGAGLAASGVQIVKAFGKELWGACVGALGASGSFMANAVQIDKAFGKKTELPAAQAASTGPTTIKVRLSRSAYPVNRISG